MKIYNLSTSPLPGKYWEEEVFPDPETQPLLLPLEDEREMINAERLTFAAQIIRRVCEVGATHVLLDGAHPRMIVPLTIMGVREGVKILFREGEYLNEGLSPETIKILLK